jgi:hypothetical protein
MTTYSFTAPDGDIPTNTELARYRKDTRRALNGYKRRKGKWINTIFNTVTQWTVILAAGTLFAHATIYA